MQQSQDQYSDQRLDDDKGRLDLSQQLAIGSRADESFQQFDGASAISRQANHQQAEVVVMNMWSRMKTLEGKYIDLANFYKQELVTSSQSASALQGVDTAISQGNSSNASKSAVGGVINPATLSLQQQSSIDGRSSIPELNEDVIINDLKAEKIKFEQNFKSIIANGGLQMNQEMIGDDFMGNKHLNPNQKILADDQLIRFNNELQGAFKDIMDQVDQSQNQAVQNLGMRQTEMFQLSTKYRMPSGFKNDAIGVWYDAKTAVTQALSQLKHFVSEKGDAVMAQAFQPSSEDNARMGKEEYAQLIERFEEEMVSLKNGAKDYSKTLAKIKQTLKIHDESIKRDQQTVLADFEDLNDAIASTNDILIGRKSMVGDSLTGSVTGNSQNEAKNGSSQPRSGSRKGTSSGPLQQSPFDKRMSNYTQNAFNRSNSRGPSIPGQKPPKLGTQTSTNGRKPSAPGLTSSPFGRGKERQFKQDSEYHPDLRIILNRLRAYDTSVAQLISETAERSEKLEDMVQRVDDQVSNSLSKFLQTHDTDLVKNFFTNTVLTPTETAQIVAKANLNAHQAPKSSQGQQSSNSKRTSVSPYRGNKSQKDAGPFGFRKNTPTRQNQNQRQVGTPSKEFGNSGKFAATGESMRLQELQSNTDQLFNELRRSNDKYIEQQVENRRLKDKVSVLQLQVEDLRIHNNRYQMKAQRDKSAGLGQRKTKTTRGTSSFGNEIVSPNRLAGYSAVSSGAYSQDRQDRDDLIAEQSELCKRIDQFFSAMKLLQRAVNRKEDISELKVEFETKQRGLQKMSKTIQSRIKSQTSGAQLKRQPQDGSYERVSSNNQNEPRNRSQSTRAVAQSMSGKQPASHRQPTSPLRAHNQYPSRPKTGKAGAASPKPPFKESLPSSSRLALEKNAVDSNQADIVYKQRQQVEMLDQQLNIAKSQISDVQDNMRMTINERDALEKIIYNHKDAFKRIEQEIDAQKQSMPQQLYIYLGNLVNSLKQDLELKENQQMGEKRPLATMQYEVQEKLMHKIATFDQAQTLKYTKLQKRLEERESELDSVKKLFVQKLRELETNFAEIGDHIIANQSQQKKSEAQQQLLHAQQQLQLQAQASSASQQKEHVSLVLDSGEQDDKALEELIQTNSQLSDQVDDLKQKLKNYVDPEESQKLKEDLNKMDEQVRILTKEKEQLVKMFGVLTAERDTASEEARKAKSDKQLTSVEVSKHQQIAQALKLEKEQQQIEILQQFKQIQIEMNDEKEQKLCFQKEAKDNESQMKLIEDELDALQNQMAIQEMEKAQQKFELEDLQEKLKAEQEKSSDAKVDKDELEQLTIKFDELELKHDVTVEQLTKSKEAQDELTKVLSEVEADAQSRQDKLSETEELLEQEKERLETISKELEQSKQLIQKLESQIEDLDKQGQSVSSKASEEQKQIETLKENIMNLQNEGQLLEEKIKQTELDKEEEVKNQQLALQEISDDYENKLEQEKTEAAQKQEQAISEAKVSADKINELGEMQTKLQEEMQQQKESLNSEVSVLKSTNSNILEESVKQQRQNWWSTALQLRLKNIVLQQLEKEKKASDELKQDLADKSQKIESHNQEKESLTQELKDKEEAEAQVLIENQTLKSKLQENDDVIKKTGEEIQLLQSQQSSSQEEGNSAIEELKQNLLDKVTEKEDEIKLLQEELDEKEVSIQKQSSELVEKVKQIKDFESQIQSMNEGNNAAETIQKSLDQKNKDFDEQSSKLSELESIKSDLDNKLKEQIALKDKVLKEKADISKSAEDREFMQASMFTDKQKEADQLKQLHDEKESIISELNEQIDIQKGLSLTSSENIKQLEKELQDAAKNYEELEESSQQLQSQLQNDLKAATESSGQDTENVKKELLTLQSQSEESTVTHEKEIEQLKSMQELEMKELDVILKEQLAKNQEKETMVNEMELEQGAMKAMVDKSKKEIQEQKVKYEKEIEELTSNFEDQKEQYKKNDQKVSDDKALNLQTEIEKVKIDQAKEIQEQKTQFENQIANIKKTEQSNQEKLNDQVKESEDKIKQMLIKEDQNKEQIKKFEESEINYKQKLEEAHNDMSSKVDSGHDNVKKIVDIHKTNEELSQQLLDKVEQNKGLEKKLKESEDKVDDFTQKREQLENDFSNQKQAYEVLLDSMAGFETTETKLTEEIKELQIVIKDLESKNETLMEQNSDLDERIEDLEKKGNGGTGRQSINSDGEEYSSVDEMKNHLKHARQILISFIQKLPYSAPENEATLPIIYSMLEFTKQEQDQCHKSRAEFNGQVDKVNDKIKSNLKGKIANIMKKKPKTDTQGSFNSGSNNTGHSNK